MSEKLHDIIEKANQLFGEGFKKGDAALATSMYTDDTLLLPPNMEAIRGKENAEAFWGNSIQMGARARAPTRARMRFDYGPS